MLFPTRVINIDNNEGIAGVLLSATSPNGNWQGLTDECGYFWPNLDAGAYHVEFSKAGYATETRDWNLSNPPTAPILVGMKSTFLKPTRDQIVNVKANFCNLFDSEGMPIFDGFIDELILNNMAKALDWVNVLKKAGTTHITLDLSGDYNEDLGWAPRYPIPGHDWTQDLSGFSNIIRWVQNQNFIPIIKLAFDGQGFDPNGLTYGWQWGMNNIDMIGNALSNFTDDVLWSTGWDGCFPNWTRDQTILMLQRMRRVFGVNACIDTEFANFYSHMGSGAADWTDDKLGILDNFSIEADWPINVIGTQQTASRLLGPEAKNIDPANAGPYYLQNTTKKANICYFEMCAYPAIRKQVTSQNAIDAAKQVSFYGYKSFGNGQP